MRACRFLLLAVLGAVSPPVLAAPPPDAFEIALPRSWVGQFHWRGGPPGLPQHYAIEFTCIEQRADGRIEATGPAEVRAGSVNKLEVRAIFDPATRAVEMFERRTPATGPGFTTDGIHRGALDADLRRMHLVWKQNGSGAQGDLVLLAAPETAKRAGRNAPLPPCRRPAS